MYSTNIRSRIDTYDRVRVSALENKMRATRSKLKKMDPRKKAELRQQQSSSRSGEFGSPGRRSPIRRSPERDTSFLNQTENVDFLDRSAFA